MKKPFFMILVCLAILAGSARAEDGRQEMEMLRKENAELKARLTQLEASVAEIKQMLTAAVARPADQPAAAPLAPAAIAPAPAPPMATAPAQPEKPPVRSKFGVELYGYIKGDGAWDSARMFNGNFAQWVESEPASGADSEYNLTARESRLGIDIRGPEMAGARTSGKVEIDFMGGGLENRPLPMMRHAYLQLEWPEHDISLIAGQTWDVISPLFPLAVNYAPGWWAGNVGYRRPQFRLTKGFKLGESTKLTLQGAATRTIGDINLLGPGDTGEDAGFPTVQARAALTFHGFSGQTATVGVSGHYGREEYDTDNIGSRVDLPSWSGSLDLLVPLSAKVTVKGEIFRGRNMDEYLGGIGQGVNPATLRGITDVGGWASVNFGPWRGWRFGVGYTADDPVNRDLGAGDRSRNRSLFGNVFFDINDAVQLGLELADWQTLYVNKADGEAIRVQTALYYRF